MSQTHRENASLAFWQSLAFTIYRPYCDLITYQREKRALIIMHFQTPEVNTKYSFILKQFENTQFASCLKWYWMIYHAKQHDVNITFVTCDSWYTCLFFIFFAWTLSLSLASCAFLGVEDHFSEFRRCHVLKIVLVIIHECKYGSPLGPCQNKLHASLENEAS